MDSVNFYVDTPTCLLSRSAHRAPHCGCMLSGRGNRTVCRQIVSYTSRRVVSSAGNMAPKRAAEDKDAKAAAKKKAKADKPPTETPSFDPKWKTIKPSMLVFGDDEPGCEKVAAFDLDGTIIEWKEGLTFSLEPGSWLWYNDTVPGKLRVCPQHDLQCCTVPMKPVLDHMKLRS